MVAFRDHRHQAGPNAAEVHSLAPDHHLSPHQPVVAIKVDDELRNTPPASGMLSVTQVFITCQTSRNVRKRNRFGATYWTVTVTCVVCLSEPEV